MSLESTLVSHQHSEGRGFASVAIIDDDELDRRHSRRMLNQVSVELTAIDEAGTWNEAVDLLIRNEHDVYLIDYGMGNHTGLELINYLVEHHQNQVFYPFDGPRQSGCGNRGRQGGRGGLSAEGRLDA